MARVSSYTTDADVIGTDKVLGSDTGGSTKNYTLDSIGSYFTRNNVVKVGGQVSYTFQTSVADFARGQFMLTASSASEVNMSAITSLYVHKEVLDGADATTYLNRVFNNQFAIYSADVINTYGVYNVTSITDDGTGLLVAVSVVNSNGALVGDDDYVISFSDTDKTYTHNQGAASATWSITHNLNKMPAVTVVDSADNVVVGEIEYNDNNSVTITFSGPFSGKAYLN